MPVLDLSAYKPVPATLGDANQVANGMQAIQNAINALDNNNFAAGLIFDPAKLMQAGAIDGDPLVWDNTLGKWKPASAMAAGRPRAPRMIVSTLAGGPPASPVDQDIWIGTGVDANGTRWTFQYNAGSASAFKWEFIGGTAVFAEVLTSETTSSAVYVDLATVGPSITLARAGDYEIGLHAQAFGSIAQLRVSPKLGAAATGDNESVRIDQVTVNQVLSGSRIITRPGLAAAAVIKLQYSTSAGTGNFLNRTLAVRPVRIT